MKILSNPFSKMDETIITASSENSFYPASNLKQHHRSKVWRSTTKTASLVFDFRTTEEVDLIVLLWPIGNYKLSDSATITVEANATNTWGSPAYSTTLTFDDRNEVALKSLTTSESYRYWKLTISDESGVNDYIELGQVLIGRSNSSIVHPALGFKFQLLDNSVQTRNRTNQTFIERYPRNRVLEIGLDDLTLSETDSLLSIFEESGVHTPVFVCLDETETLFTSGLFSIYGRMQSNLSLSHKFRDYFGSSLTLIEEG